LHTLIIRMSDYAFRMFEYAFLFMDAFWAFLDVKSMSGRLEVSPLTWVTASID